MPEPILIAVATTLATKAATGLYDLVKRKFSGDVKATAALETAAPEDPKTLQALAERLETAQAQDAEFAEALREKWAEVSVEQHAESGGVNNQITGAVSGKVLQAGDIHGNVSF
ncbi:hypothetical protein [Amycolatopsis sp. H20-H5]|uniref:hypothetical protein n=1 Tax=Amycolatopsis sp. H20-H5 TaxID=3046309 RepID=UPI002DBE03C6|nr:hypothetical protein [Amycolatopsis sp. H20-H5]MEC3974528.1 hypothetical protein [Amycolatopsis sp. H20-H5]